jgi:hypothetical protein
VGRREQEGSEAAQRMPDHRARSELQLLNDVLRVGDVCGTRDVARDALAATVPARVERDNAMVLAQPSSGLQPLIGISRETVKQERRRPSADELAARQPNSLPLDRKRPRHTLFSSTSGHAKPPMGWWLARCLFEFVGWGLTSCVFYGYNAWAAWIWIGWVRVCWAGVCATKGCLGEGRVRTMKGLFSRDC